MDVGGTSSCTLTLSLKAWRPEAIMAFSDSPCMKSTVYGIQRLSALATKDLPAIGSPISML